MGVLVAALGRKGNNVAQKVVTMLEVAKHKSYDTFFVVSPEHVNTANSAGQLRKVSFESSTAIGHLFIRILPEDNPQIRLEDGRAVAFDGRVYCQKTPTLAHFILDELGKSPKAILRLNGCFAFAIARHGKLIVGRDALGLYPLYYGVNEKIFAVASERKALWRIGLEKTYSFPPGHLAFAGGKSLYFKPVKTFKEWDIRPRENQMTLEEAAEKLLCLLNQSFNKRVCGLDEVAVAFSGGLDSSLTALLAQKAGAKVQLIHVSLKNQPETKQAEETAKSLGMPIRTYLYTEEDVANILPEVLHVIEEPDPVKTCIGIPLFWTAEKAAEMGFRVLLAGQGADELFGGYMRYFNSYVRYGYSFARKEIFSEALKMHETNFERDSKICIFHRIELRLPFATHQMLEFALKLPFHYKIESKSDSLRKVVLRKAAEKAGLPTQIVKKPKKALQYATGVSKAVKKLAKKSRLPLKVYLQKIFQNSLHY